MLLPQMLVKADDGGRAAALITLEERSGATGVENKTAMGSGGMSPGRRVECYEYFRAN